MTSKIPGSDALASKSPLLRQACRAEAAALVKRRPTASA